MACLSPRAETVSRMINWDRVEELKSDLGADDFLEIVSMFLEEVEAKLAALDQGQSESLTEDFHFLKGCAANLGFEVFQKTCASAEMTGAPDDVPKAVEIYEASKQEFMSRST